MIDAAKKTLASRAIRNARGAPSRSPRRARQEIAHRLDLVSDAGRRDALALGDQLIELGLLTDEGVDRINAAQKKTGEDFARLAVQLRLVRPQHMHAALAIYHGFLREDKTSLAIPRALFVLRKPMSAGAEQLRSVRAALLTSVKPEKAALFSVVGSGADASASMIAANLAVALTQVKRKVLLIDANLRRPSISKLFGVEPEIGLGDVLANRADLENAYCDCLVERLTLLPSLARPRDGQELLGEAGLTTVLERARRDFDHVIIVSPGQSGQAEGQFVWAASGACLVVAHQGEARANEVAELSGTMRKLGAEIIGAVMTE